MLPIQSRTSVRNCVLGFLLIPTLAQLAGAQVQQQKLLPTDPGSYYGSSLSVSQDRMAVSDSVGVIRIYLDTSSGWVLDQTLVSPTPGAELDFGRSIALDENRLLVGAPNDPENGFGSGAAYLYEYSGDDWSLVQKLVGADTTIGDHFGSSVALDGDRIVVGAPWVSSHGANRGAAYAFEYTGDFLGWLQLALLTDEGGTEHSRFGHQVDIEGDLIVVGAEGDSFSEPAAGSASIFRRLPTGWVAEAKLLAEDPVPLHNFGFAVDVSGDAVVIGAHSDPEVGHAAGAVYAYRIEEGSWALEQKILPPHPQDSARFGYDVELDGNVLAVGTRASLFGTTDAGSVEVLEHDSGSWTWVQTLLPDTPSDYGFYGSSIEIQGDLVAVSMPLDSAVGPFSGSVFLHSRSQFASAYCHCDAGSPCDNTSSVGGCANSSGVGAQLSAGGSGSVAADDLTLLLTDLPAHRATIVCTGPGRGRSPLGDGLLCLSDLGGIRRFPIARTNASGGAQVGPGLVAYSESRFGSDLAFSPGATRHFQAWYRDPEGPCGNTTNLTHGLTVSFGL